MLYTIKIIVILCIQKTICDNKLNYDNVNDTRSSYKGEHFPTKYLLPENTVPTALDLDYYLKSLQKTVNYFDREIRGNNDTEANRVLGMYFMKAIAKRTLRDHGEKLTKSNYKILEDIIKKGDEYVSLYVYLIKHEFMSAKVENLVASLVREDSAHVFSIGNFNKGRMLKWIHSYIRLHSYVENMDNLTLTKEKFAYITEDMDSSNFSVDDSDKCISRVVYNPEPIHLSELRQCRPDRFCYKAMKSLPSVAYALSHRLLYILMLRQNRRCYVYTEKEDDDFMDTLCAFMYREAVYLARRGYFARDLFLEHVALCGLFGYEEFFRHQWFRKSASWVDDQGCISEGRNFLINRTVASLQINADDDDLETRKLRKRLKMLLINECHSHPMALLMIVLAHAIRHALHFMAKER